MACVNPDGTLSPAATSLLKALAASPLTPEKVALQANQPLFKVRSSIREMIQAGFLSQQGDEYIITDAGRTQIK